MARPRLRSQSHSISPESTSVESDVSVDHTRRDRQTNTGHSPRPASVPTRTDTVPASAPSSDVSNDQVARRLIFAQTKAGTFAADRIVFFYKDRIHRSQTWTVTEDGVIAEPDEAPSASISDTHAQKPLDLALVVLKSDLTPVTGKDDPLLVTSAIEVAEHIEGPVAGRIVRILYRIANDPPFLRHSRITVDMNELLDDLGYERTAHGYHNAPNRERVRDALLALSRVEIRGERFDHAGGREFYSAPLITIRGGYYQERETRDIPLSELLERGLPSKLHIELGWYEGVRRSDGSIGNNYLLLPRDLSYFRSVGQADHMKTEDLLAEFLWLRYSLQFRRGLTLSLTLDVALKHAGVTNSNVTRARQTLEKALQSLMARGHVAHYTPLPAKRSQSFTVTLRLPGQDGQAHVEPHSLWEAPPDSNSLAIHPPDDTELLLESNLTTASDPNELQPQDDAPYELPAYAGEPVLEGSPSTGSYMQVLRIGSYSLPAELAWHRIQEQSHTELSAAVRQHLGAVQPLWRVDTLADGDIQYWLHLGIATGLRPRLESSEPTLQRIADQLYPKAFGIMFGPPHGAAHSG